MPEQKSKTTEQIYKQDKNEQKAHLCLEARTAHRPLSYAVLGTFAPLKGLKASLLQLAINAIYDHLGKPGSVSMLAEMTDAEILLNDVADFRHQSSPPAC